MLGRLPLDLDIPDLCARRPEAKLADQCLDDLPVALRDHLDTAIGKIATEAGKPQSLRGRLRKRPVIDALHSTADKNLGTDRHKK